jgi:predicted TIM-barrel fold metal-dependent hydrolase
MSNAEGRIDTHVHYLTERYRRAAVAAGHVRPDGMPGYPDWSPESALAAMDRAGIATAILSMSSPGIQFGTSRDRSALARAVNDDGADVVARNAARFGLFASLPLPNVDDAMAELERAFDTLRVDGVVLPTNVDGIYLGDARLDPIMSELNKRRAVIFIHPVSPGAAEPQGLSYPVPMIEFMFETTRAIANLVLSGCLRRNPDVTVIVPHAGAALPTLSDRIAAMVPFLRLPEPMTPPEILAQFARLHFDLGGHSVPKMLDSLLATTTVEHLHYGSDAPFTPEPVIGRLAKLIDESPRFTASDREMIYRTNALALFPRLNRK